jgi:hypothetical protein
MKILSPVTESTHTTHIDDLMTGHNYLDFLQNGLLEQLEDAPLATDSYALSA